MTCKRKGDAGIRGLDGLEDKGGGGSRTSPPANNLPTPPPPPPLLPRRYVALLPPLPSHTHLKQAHQGGRI